MGAAWARGGTDGRAAEPIRRRTGTDEAGFDCYGCRGGTRGGGAAGTGAAPAYRERHPKEGGQELLTRPIALRGIPPTPCQAHGASRYVRAG